MLGHRADLPLRAAGGDDHVVGDAGLPGEVDDDDVFGPVVIQGPLDHSEQVLGRRRTEMTPSYGVTLARSFASRARPAQAGSRTRMRVAEAGLTPSWKKIQAGGRLRARRQPANGRSRQRRKRPAPPFRPAL